MKKIIICLVVSVVVIAGGIDSYSQRIRRGWNYLNVEDKMTQKKIRVAYVVSSNYARLSFPYQGNQKAMLNLRSHPKWGKEAYINLSRAQFLCKYNGCSVRVRFDNNPPQVFQASKSTSHQTNILFLSKYEFNRFLNNVKKSKKIYIEAMFYRDGAIVFEFDVRNLKWKN